MMSEDIHKWTDGRYTLMFDEHTFFVFDNEKEKRMTALEVTKKLNEQQELIEELQASDEMGWERAEKFEKKLEKELKQKKIYIKRLEYKVQKFKEENEQLRQELQEKQEEEKLYANEILELNKTKKEMLNFKQLGGDY